MSGKPPPGSPGRGTVLIAEDDPATRMVLKRLLIREDFRVVAVENGKLACEAVRREHPDVVLLDWRMPVMDGRAVLEELRSSHATRGIPIVMLTSHDHVDERITALEAGVQDYLSKPFDPRELVACIEQQLRWRHGLASDADVAFLAERDELRVASERRRRLFAEAMPHIVWLADAKGRITYFNRAWYEYAGGAPAKTGFTGWSSALHPDDRLRAQTTWSAARSAQQIYELHCRLRRAADDSYRWHLVRAIPTTDEGGRIVEWVGSCTDIHDYRIASETRAILDTMPQMVWVSGSDAPFEYVNHRWAEYTGLDLTASCAAGWDAIVHADDRGAFDPLREPPAQPEFTCEARFRCADGTFRWHMVRAVPLNDRAGPSPSWIGTATDIEESKSAAALLAHTVAQLEHLAHHDAMTDLPNRTLLGKRLAQAIALAKRAKTEVIVLYIDLDGFKLVNDKRGHSAGDRVLAATAARIGGSLRAGDTASRVGGDEFVLVCATADAAGDAPRLAARVIAAIGAPIDLDGQAVTVGASIGISLYPADGVSGDELIRRADSAMYTAKQCGRNRFRMCAPGTHASAVAALELEAQVTSVAKPSEIVA